MSFDQIEKWTLANRFPVYLLCLCHVNYKLSRHKLRSELILLWIYYFPGIYFSSVFFCCNQFVLLVRGWTRNNVTSAAPLKLSFFCLPVLIRLIYAWNHLKRLAWYWTPICSESLFLCSSEFCELAISLYRRSVVLELHAGQSAHDAVQWGKLFSFLCKKTPFSVNGQTPYSFHHVPQHMWINI
jgi:hypothetical protein